MRQLPRAFIVQRDEDPSGVSGTGVVAEGVQFSDGWAVTHWLGGPPKYQPKTEVWHNKGTEPFEDISGHGGRTRIVFADQLPPNQSPLTGIEVRDPCPRCEGRPRLIPRSLMDEHNREHHPDTAPAPVPGGLREQLAEALALLERVREYAAHHGTQCEDYCCDHAPKLQGLVGPPKEQM